MRIKEMIHQHRRDFSAIFECEHCDYLVRIENGYDDRNYHENVIPRMVCGQCEKTSPDTYVPRETKYMEGLVV